MLSIYDLYDLSAIFKNIRAFPEYELNCKILMKTIGVLKNRDEEKEMNAFRIALRSISSLDQSLFLFAYTDNLYVYFPTFLKDTKIYMVLIKCCECLLAAIEEKNLKKAQDLADCIHNLPIYIADNHMRIPQCFWKTEVNYYRKKWDKAFLKIGW